MLFGAYISGLTLSYVARPHVDATTTTQAAGESDEEAEEERVAALSFEHTFARTIGPLQQYVLAPLFFASIGYAIVSYLSDVHNYPKLISAVSTVQIAIPLALETCHHMAWRCLCASHVCRQASGRASDIGVDIGSTLILQSTYSLEAPKILSITVRRPATGSCTQRISYTITLRHHAPSCVHRYRYGLTRGDRAAHC